MRAAGAVTGEGAWEAIRSPQSVNNFFCHILCTKLCKCFFLSNVDYFVEKNIYIIYEWLMDWFKNVCLLNADRQIDMYVVK